MKPYLISMLGLAMDIVGAFFLAAEAIKIENIRGLRQRYIEQAHTASLSPKIIWTDQGNGYIQASRRYLFLFTALHYVAGFIVLLVLNAALHGQLLDWLFQATNWLFGLRWYWIALGIPIALVYGGVFGVWMVGECVHVTLTWSLRGAIRLLEFIERRTPDGAVGMLSYLLLFVGFALQMLGTYLGGRSGA